MLGEQHLGLMRVWRSGCKSWEPTPERGFWDMNIKTWSKYKIPVDSELEEGAKILFSMPDTNTQNQEEAGVLGTIKTLGVVKMDVATNLGNHPDAHNASEWLLMGVYFGTQHCIFFLPRLPDYTFLKFSCVYQHWNKDVSALNRCIFYITVCLSAYDLHRSHSEMVGNVIHTVKLFRN